MPARPSRAARKATKASGKKRRSLVWRLRRPLFLVGLLLVAALSGSGFVLANVPLPPPDIPVETTFIYDASGNKIAELSGGENRESRRLDDMSPDLVTAVLAAEDRDFFTHPGIDATAILRATWADLRGRPLQGGSTITQQYVKNVYVGNERSLLRKLREATLAVKLERKFDKEEILERYLNTIYFGRGAYGVQAASNAYFDKDVSQLDMNEAAYLAGLIRAPEAADAEAGDADKTAEANRRRDGVLDDLVEIGELTPAERDYMAARPVEEMTRPREEVVQDRLEPCGCGLERVIEHVRRELAERYGDARVNGGGLRVFTTIDMELQRIAYDAVYRRTLDRPEDPAGALVALDTDGRIRAMVGGREPDPAAPTPWDKVNLATGRQGGGTGRQPGSAFKPFVLATAVAEGYTVESALPSPAEVEFPEGDGGRPYNVENYGGASYGRQNLVDATRVSSNTVYAQLIDILGPENVAAMAARLGITSEITPNLSMALGTPTVSVLDMANGFLSFATRGERVEPTIVSEVRRADGTLVDVFSPVRERVLQPEQADVITEVLRGVVEDGTGTRADPGGGVPVAGKTGTTQGNGDAWFVGYTPRLTAAVWMGYPEGQSRQLKGIHGVPAVTGGTLPADIFRRFLERALELEPYRGGEFVEPDGFPGRVLSNTGRIVARDVEEEPVVEGETTTTSTTATTAPPGSTTTTVAPTPSTTAPPATTTTTAPPATTTTSAPPVASPAGGPGGPSG